MDRSKIFSYNNFDNNLDFFSQNVIYRFEVPKTLTVDNGTQFDSEAFRVFCNQVGTSIHFYSIRYPESNGLVERENGIILLGITKSLVGLLKGKWTEELIKVVWNHNTSVSRSTEFTPFKLLFRDEVVIQKEIRSRYRSSQHEDKLEITQ
jgi:transposase InsO family protein